MKITDLDYNYPDSLVAVAPERPSRVAWVDLSDSKDPMWSEISFANLIECFKPGDVLVINDTKVLKRRVFSGDLEVLFLSSSDQQTWEVLFPSKKSKIGEVISLPLGKEMTLLQKGRPQIVKTSEALDESYFEQVAELPLPPYIQKARLERHNQAADQSWYQTAWAQQSGSFAAPTASLHFSKSDLVALVTKGVEVVTLTLHVGLGTFLPVTAEDLNDHQMHEEYVEIPSATWAAVQKAKKEKRTVWAMGTTVTRALESAAHNKIKMDNSGHYRGMTDILIQPGYQFAVVDGLLTNFHQPQSTLLALVSAFASLETVKSVYQWAIDKKFRLFSYGDLSVWKKH
jgi:S-adenosylmethionine:tRNA ribosyltransferase-isomerase